MSDIEGWDGRVWCGVCLHESTEHDGMGDCHHVDGRTSTGYCKCSEKRANRDGSDDRRRLLNMW